MFQNSEVNCIKVDEAQCTNLDHLGEKFGHSPEGGGKLLKFLNRNYMMK